jgi:16S rRNA (uracil1498-N3)-methyltransferase
LPEVGEPVDTAALADVARRAAAALVLHESASTSLSTVPLPVSGDLLVVVGPEGGITDDELAALSCAGSVPVRLGPTVLRASTAAAVALGAIGVLTQRWAQTSSAAPVD